MTYLEKVHAFAEKAQEDFEKYGDKTTFTFLEGALECIPKYHNFVLNYMAKQDFQKFRLEQEDFAAWRDEQEGTRITYHKAMIDAVIQLNRYAKSNGIEPIYEGPIDDERRYDDPDTRFGIAEWSDKYCSEVFNAGVMASIKEAHIDLEIMASEGGKLSEIQERLPQGLKLVNQVKMEKEFPDHVFSVTIDPQTNELIPEIDGEKSSENALKGNHRMAYEVYKAVKAVMDGADLSNRSLTEIITPKPKEIEPER